MQAHVHCFIALPRKRDVTHTCCTRKQLNCTAHADVDQNDDGTLKANQTIERGSSAVECPTRNQGSPGLNPALLPFRRLGILVLSIDATVDSAV